MENLSKEELLHLLRHYDMYIQDSNTKDLYVSGWRPVCIDEFYNNEYQEILEQGE